MKPQINTDKHGNSFSPKNLLCLSAFICGSFFFLCGCIKGPDFPFMLSPRAIVQTPTNPASANIAVSFQLIDREKENGNVILQYSTDSGASFKSATLVDTFETQNLQSDWYPGIIHTVLWNSVTDMVGISGNALIIVKVTPSDATNPSGGTSDVSGTFTVNNIGFNQPPGVNITTPTGVQLGNIPINYFLSDVESDTCSIVVEYSTDDGENWQTATMGWAGDGLTGLSSSPSPGTAHIFLWDSRADGIAPIGQEDDIKIRITPRDFHTGNSTETASFSVDNTLVNSPPTVSITDGPAEGSTVYTRYATFTWSGSDTDGIVIGYYYSFDRDPPNIWTTEASVTSGVLSLGQYTFRVQALDDRYDFSATVSRTFTVAPGVIQADFNASPASGTAPLTVNFTDLSTASSGIDTWSWNFGDSGTSTEQNPVHIYTSVRSYTVSLTVTGPDGSDTETKTNYITVTPPGPTIYVDGTNGSDTHSGLSWAQAVKTIQKGLDLAGATGSTVWVANGTYTGTGNKDLDFKGKAIDLRSVGGAANCIIDCENSGRGFYFHSSETAEAIVEGFTIRNGSSNPGGGILCVNYSSPRITNCTIANNSVSNDGGGIDCESSSNAAITNCIIVNNRADYGGAIRSCFANPSIINCLIANNSTHSGGAGICSTSGSLTITNCTITNNRAETTVWGYGGGIMCDGSSIMVNNTIIWGNSAVSGGNQISTNTSSVTLNYCDYGNGANDVAGPGTVTPNNCINLDPLFVDAANGNFRLQATSPCIDAGFNDYIVGYDTDLDGNPRIVDGNNDGTATVDLGAYEYSVSAPTWALAVASQYGIANPPVGTHTYNFVASVTASVDSPVNSATAGVRYVCTGWAGTGSVPSVGTGSSVTFILSSPSSITWTWAVQYKLAITVSPLGAGTVARSPDAQWYWAGDEVNLTATPQGEFTFSSWTGPVTNPDEPNTPETVQVIMDGAKSVTANFTPTGAPTIVTLTVISAYGSPDPPVGTHYCVLGAEITLSAGDVIDPGTGTRYACSGWTDGTGNILPSSGTGTSYNFTMTNDMDSAITWTWQIEYRLMTRTSPEGGGTITRVPDSAWYAGGTSVELSANAAPGFSFFNWSGDLTSTFNPQNITIDAFKRVTANFTGERFAR